MQKEDKTSYVEQVKTQAGKMLVLSDVDGCLTDGKFIYTVDGKVAKTFGPHDADGVKMLKKNGVMVKFITADKRGLPITKKRIADMGCELYVVSEEMRKDFIANAKEKYNCDTVVFFGDGINDALAAAGADYFFAPNNARIEAKAMASFVTPSDGGNGAFLDMSLYIVNHIL